MFILVCLFSCKKDAATNRSSDPDRNGTDIGEGYREMAREYANVKLAGISDAVKDTLYFSYTLYTWIPDSATYRKSFMDKTAVDAFKYTFQQAKNKPNAWKHLWFAFDVQFIHDRTDSIIRFQYPLNMSMFSF